LRRLRRPFRVRRRLRAASRPHAAEDNQHASRDERDWQRLAAERRQPAFAAELENALEEREADDEKDEAYPQPRETLPD